MSSNIQTDETSGETSASVKRCTKDCQDRRPGCHSGCEIYAKQREKWDRIAEGKRKEYETTLPVLLTTDESCAELDENGRPIVAGEEEEDGILRGMRGGD